MLDALSNLLDPAALLAQGIDVFTFTVLALIGTTIFLIRMGLAFLVGIDMDFDVDLDADSDGFGILSLHSISAFLMGAGWGGLVAKLELGFGSAASTLMAIVIGTVFMSLAAGTMLLIRKMVHDPKADPNTALNTLGKVYMPIPTKGEGSGQVELVVISGKKENCRGTQHRPRNRSVYLSQSRLKSIQDGSVVVEPREPVTKHSTEDSGRIPARSANKL